MSEEKKSFIVILKEECEKEGVELAEESVKAAIEWLAKVIPAVAIRVHPVAGSIVAPLVLTFKPKLIELAEKINKADNA